jgi:hypothetical protein
MTLRWCPAWHLIPRACPDCGCGCHYESSLSVTMCSFCHEDQQPAACVRIGWHRRHRDTFGLAWQT